MSNWESALYFCAAIGGVSLLGTLVLVLLITTWQWWEIACEKCSPPCSGYGLDGDGREAECGCVQCAEER